MILIFCFCIYFHTSKGAEYCEVRSYDEKDANRIQYAVMHHLTRSDKQEIYRGLIQGLNKQQSTAEASIETVISGFDSLGITTVELNHTYESLAITQVAALKWPVAFHAVVHPV